MPSYYNPYDEEQRPAAEPRQPEAAQPARDPEPAAPKSTRRRTAPASDKRPKARKESATATVVDMGRVKMFSGIVLLLVAAYFLVAAISTLFSAGADQAAIVYNSLGQITSTGRTVSNSAGPAGALIGHIMMIDTLGLGSFVLIYWLAATGLKLVGWSKVKFWPLTFKCLILAITVSVVAGLVTYTMADPLRWGGNHGYYVNDMLIRLASPLGAICVSIALIAAVIIIYLTQISNAIAAYRRKIAALRAEREARQAKEREDRAKVAEQMADSVQGTPAAEKADEQPEPEEEDPVIDLAGEAEEPDEEIDDPDEPAPTEPAATDDEEEKEARFEITANRIEEADRIETDTYDPTAELSFYRLPPIDLLEDRRSSDVTVDTEEQEANKQRIIDALAQFKIEISSIKATVGPTITLFEVVPAPGQRISAIKRVEEDLALALKAKGIRIIAPIPGKGTIGIEVPNAEPQVVSMRSIIASKKFQECKYELPMALGATISNEVFIADLAKMPHLLVAGATGQGKSVGLNAIITSLLYKKHPAELKFVMVDPKSVEFSLYKVLERHYLAKLPDEEEPIITESGKVIATLNSLCVEMDNRYTLLKNAGCRNLTEYNAKFIARRLNPEKGHRFLPYIVLVIDEFADLIMTAGKEIETPICRIGQKARAVGIHAIIATQRPSTTVITGLIKAQFPGRIAFRVAQMTDSRTIIDRPGAQSLIGKGDMLFCNNGNTERVQCAFVDTPEVDAICEYIGEQQGYPCAYELPEYVPDHGGDGGGAAMGGQPGSPFDRDPLFEEAARFLIAGGDKASTSSLQRRYNIGYNRAGRLMDQLEAAGIVGPAIGSKPRNVLVDSMTLDSILGL